DARCLLPPIGCGQPLTANDLTDQETAREWHISGLCPPCFSRAEAYRQVADELALMQSVEPDHRHAAGLYSAEQCARRMADAA
ncbi:hypothetical protein KBZ21_40345, partial [Streptomyces sp. A73]|nr:hypothetical protein [Streptomyces sp. A73]